MTEMWQGPPPVRLAHRRLLRLAVAASAAAVLALVVVGAYLVYHHRPSPVARASTKGLSTIEAMPEATLLPPDSHIFARSGSGRTLLGYESFDTVAAVNATKTKVFDFYKHQLAERGWQGPASDDLNAPNHWTRGHYQWGIVFLGRPGDNTYPGEAQYTTTFTMGIQYTPNAAPSAPPSP